MFWTKFKQQAVTLPAFCLWTFFATSRALFGDDAEVSPLQFAERFAIQIGEPIVVPEEVFGDKYQFVLDTGCNLSMFENSFSDRLGEVVKHQRAMTPTSVWSFEFFAAPEIKVGLRFSEAFQSRANVACADLSHVREAGRGDEMGIIGMDFLKNHVVYVNFDEGVAQFKSLADTN